MPWIAKSGFLRTIIWYTGGPTCRQFKIWASGYFYYAGRKNNEVDFMLSAMCASRKMTQKVIQLLLLTTLCLVNLNVWGETEKNSSEISLNEKSLTEKSAVIKLTENKQTEKSTAGKNSSENNLSKNGSQVNKNGNVESNKIVTDTKSRKVLSDTQKNQKESQVTVQLSEIVAEKTTENSGDEIYINITSYSNLGYSKESRVPNYPKNWISKNLDQIKDLNLWEGAIKEGEEVKIILTVAEQDSPPWDIDDLIGSAQLTLTRKDGQLIKEWGLPIFEEKAETVQSTEKNNKMLSQKYLFTGDNSRYNVIFKLEEK